MVWSLCSPHDLYLLYSRAMKLRIAAGRPESLLNVSCRLRSACFPLFRFQKAGIVRHFLLISLLMKHSCGCLAASSGIGFFLLLFCLLLKCTVLCHVVCCFITLRWTHGTENKVIHKIFPRSKLKPSTNSERNTSGPTCSQLYLSSVRSREQSNFFCFTTDEGHFKVFSFWFSNKDGQT